MAWPSVGDDDVEEEELDDDFGFGGDVSGW